MDRADQNEGMRKKSLTRRIKDMIKRRSQESNSQDLIYDCPSPQQEQNNERPTSLFIQLGEEAAQEESEFCEEEKKAEERRQRMQILYEEDNRKSWPLERLQALKLNICEADNIRSPKRASISEVVDRAKEHRRSLTESIPIPNIPGTSTSNPKDDSDSSAEEDSD